MSIEGALQTLRELLPLVGAEDAAAASIKLAALQRDYEEAGKATASDVAVLATVVPESAPAPAAKAEAAGELTDAQDAADAAALKKKEANRKKRAMQKSKRAEQKVASSEGSIAFPANVRSSVRCFIGEARGRGLQCTRRVRKGELLIGIPKAWALSTAVASTKGGSTGQIALALELVQRRRAGDAHFAHLPDSLDMPAFWSSDELEFLRGSLVHEPACSQRSTLESMHAERAIPPDMCSLDEFVWAMCMVQSRTFGGDGTMVILPFIDLINSDAAPNLSFDLRQEDGYIQCMASRDFEAGEEALVNYHGRGKPSLFSNFLAYGFVPEEVEYPSLFPCGADDPADKMRAALEKWSEHGKTLASAPALQGDGAAADADSALPADPARRLAIARRLLTHEREMTTTNVSSLRRRLLALKKR